MCSLKNDGIDYVEPFGPLIQLALAGNDRAWQSLIERLSRLVWKATFAFDLNAEERSDARAATFARLYENLSRVTEPEHLPGWIATVARNEVLAVLRSRHRFNSAMAANPIPVPESLEGSVDEEMDLRAAVRQALKQLPESAQTLIRCLTCDPPMSYADISERLNIPIGAIGPTRQRTIARLRRSPELLAFMS